MLKKGAPANAKSAILADVMLAKLARWLRLAGIAVKDVPMQDDGAILKYTKKSGATLLTSDVALSLRARKRRIAVLLVDQHDLDCQLAYVIESLKLEIETDPSKTLCPKCGLRLNTVSSDFASRRGLLESITERYSEFYYCKKCNKLYWQGAHWDKIKDRLKRVSEIQTKFKMAPVVQNHN